MTTTAVGAKQAKHYRAAHPEVDWDHNIVTLARDSKGNWKAVGHRAWTAADEKLLAPCCGGSCPIHAGDGRA